jgi:hypothetical protein
MGEHSWVRVIAGASALQVPPSVTPRPLPHLRAPTRYHRQAHALRLPAPDAHGAPGSWIGQATASPAPAQDVAGRIRRAWWARFTGNVITRYERGTYDLVGGKELSDAEREELLQLCRQRLDRVKLLGLVLPEKADPAGQGA